MNKLFAGRTILITIVVIVIVNLLASIYYINLGQKKEILADRAELIGQIASSLQLFEDYKPANYDRLARIAQTEHLKVTTSKQPEWPNAVTDDYLLNITSLVENAEQELKFSVKLENGIWVNYNYKETNHQLVIEILFIAFETIVATLLLITAWLIERFRKPLKRFKQAADKLGIELHVEPVMEYGPSIVRETSDAMNQMQQRIVKLLQDRTQMLAAISHDLRTPITRMKMRTQISPNEDSPDILHDLDEMEAMIDQILLYTKDASQQEELQSFDLAALLLSICDESCEMGHSVECDIKVTYVPFQARQLSLKRALTNLINNAIKYANNVFVTLKLNTQQVIIIIEDDGPGLPEQDLEKVFTPFYRVDQSRSAKTGGTGLGLAIVHDVIHGHKGTIYLENREKGGLRVVVKLPLGSH